jgi:predicted DNA-binding ribbon-helix-helix protein
MATALQLVAVNSSLKSRNVTVHGHRTSVRLEPAMWAAIKAISTWERLNINEIVSAVALSRDHNSSLTSAIRIFVMAYFRANTQTLRLDA